MFMKQIDSRLIEAALFSAGRPLSIRELQELTGMDKNEVTSSLRSLVQSYRKRETSLEISRVGRKYTMKLREQYAKPVRSLATPDIPRKLWKTLALIAYHEPVKQSELQTMLGSRIYDHVRELKELTMITMKADGNTRIISTTHLFPEYFGIDSGDKSKIKMYLAKRVGLILDDEIEEKCDPEEKRETECVEEKEEEQEELPGLEDDDISESDMYPDDDEL
jgi:segregation and condensation protein B